MTFTHWTSRYFTYLCYLSWNSVPYVMSHVRSKNHDNNGFNFDQHKRKSAEWIPQFYSVVDLKLPVKNTNKVRRKQGPLLSCEGSNFSCFEMRYWTVINIVDARQIEKLAEYAAIIVSMHGNVAKQENIHGLLSYKTVDVRCAFFHTCPTKSLLISQHGVLIKTNLIQWIFIHAMTELGLSSWGIVVCSSEFRIANNDEEQKKWLRIMKNIIDWIEILGGTSQDTRMKNCSRKLQMPVVVLTIHKHKVHSIRY